MTAFVLGAVDKVSKSGDSMSGPLTLNGDPPLIMPGASPGDVLTVDSSGNVIPQSITIGLGPSGDTTGTVDSANVQALINLRLPVQLAPGTFTFKSPWQPVSGMSITGSGRLSTLCNWVTSVSAINANSATQLDGCEISELTMSVAGAHLVTGGFCARWHIHDSGLIQNSAGFGIWNATLTGSQTMVECVFERNSEQVFGSNRTVEAWLLSGPDGSHQINQCAWRDNRCFNQNNDASQYWYHIQNTGSNNAGNSFDNIVFEHPFGGMIWLESHTLGFIRNCLAYDLPSGSGTISNHLIKLSKNAGGVASSRNLITGGPRNQAGVVFAAGIGDIGLDSASTATTIVAPAASGSLKLFLGGSRGVKLTGMPDGGYGIQDSATTVAAGVAAGTGATATATAGPTNECGTVTVTTGTASLTTGALATVTFGTPFEAAPVVVIMPEGNGRATTVQPWVNGQSSTGFTLNANTAPASISTPYAFFWHAIV